MKSKLFKKIIVFMAILLLCILTFTACVNLPPVVRIRIQNRYGIDIALLKKCKIECEIKGHTFTGRAPRYLVIKVKEEPTEFLNSFQFDDNYEPDRFSSEKNPELKNRIDLHLDCCITIPDEFYPDWDDDYLWRISDFISIIYFPNQLRLVVYDAGY